MLSVSAKDKLSGKEQAIRITPSTGLSKDEIDRMILESKQYAENDRKAKQLAELRNRINAQMLAVSRSYSGFGYLLDAVEQEMIKNSLQKAKSLSAEESDSTMLRDLLAELERGAAKLSSAMFQAPGHGELSADGGQEETPADSEARLNQLLKSALKDVKTKN